MGTFVTGVTVKGRDSEGRPRISKRLTEAEEEPCDPTLVTRLSTFLERNAEWIVSEGASVSFYAESAEPVVLVTHDDGSDFPELRERANRRLVVEGFETNLPLDLEPERRAVIEILGLKPNPAPWIN